MLTGCCLGHACFFSICYQMCFSINMIYLLFLSHPTPLSAVACEVLCERNSCQGSHVYFTVRFPLPPAANKFHGTLSEPGFCTKQCKCSVELRHFCGTSAPQHRPADQLSTKPNSEILSSFISSAHVAHAVPVLSTVEVQDAGSFITILTQIYSYRDLLQICAAELVIELGER